MSNLSPETVKRIEQEAIDHYSSPYGNANPETHAYISGAIAWAEKVESLESQLKESLLLYQNMCDQITKDQREINYLASEVARLNRLVSDENTSPF